MNGGRRPAVHLLLACRIMIYQDQLCAGLGKRGHHRLP